MYSVFLVGGKALCREEIKNTVEWGNYGFDFAGEAADGELAWSQIQKYKPDIVIADVKMPFMDGLTLSRLIKKELVHTAVILISEYDSFQYTKEAISIGVNRYLLKPVSKDDLIRSLLEIKELKDTRNEQTEYLQRYNSEVREYISGSRRSFFEALISERYPLSDLLERAEKLSLSLVAESYNVILFSTEEDFLENGYSSNNADLLAELSARFIDNRHIVLFDMGIDLTVFLIKSDLTEIDIQTRYCTDIIKSVCATYECIVKYAVIVGSPVSRLSSVGECYRKVRGNLVCAPSDSGGANIITSPAILDFDPDNTDAEKTDRRIIETFLTNGLAEDLQTFVQDYFESFGTQVIESFMLRQYLLLNALFAVTAFLKKIGCDKKINSEIPFSEALSGIDATKQYVRQLLAYAVSARDSAASSRYNVIVKKAVDYINEHYSDSDIDLNTVAQTVNVSATHFSMVFSQQMNKTFVEYLTERRMERARELLRCTDKSLSDISSEIGYNDSHYFSFLFKKLNGCPPRNYRAMKDIK